MFQKITLHGSCLARTPWQKLKQPSGLDTYHVSACLQAAGNALAANGLAALQLNATPDSAAGLLKRIGWWDPHAQMALLRLGVTPDFGSRLQVRVSHVLSRQLTATAQPATTW